MRAVWGKRDGTAINPGGGCLIDTPGEYKTFANIGHVEPVVKGYVRGVVEQITVASVFS
jgi:hypothetical protein